MRQALRFEARSVADAGGVSFSMREPTTDERRSYFSKKSGYLRYSAIVAAPGHDDLPQVELPRSKRDPRMRHKHRGRAQVSTAGRAQHVEEIRQAFGAGDSDRFDPAALPAGEQGSCIGVGPRAAVAFGVLDSRAPLFESRSQPLASALPAKDHDRAPLQILQLGKRGERLAFGFAAGGRHPTGPLFLECSCGSDPQSGHTPPPRPVPAPAHESLPPYRSGPTHQNPHPQTPPPPPLLHTSRRPP